MEINNRAIVNHYLIIKLLFLFGLLVVVTDAHSQFYNTGQDRGSIKWKQIDTEKFRLVYPQFAEQKAQNFANKLLWASQNVGKGLDTTTTKVDVIMHMESSTSNAMVIWAPKRMEVHALSPQNTYAEEWFEQLALHEYRHVVQIDKLNEGFTKIISIVFGEMGTSVVLGAYLPLWYLEGDAVAIETSLSNTGRGREANFNMPLRAQITEKGKYSYDKATMGSYHNFVPDHYILGYHLVTLGKINYGKDIWKNTESFIARNPYYIVPFSHSIKKHSSLRKRAFYNASMDTLNNMWQRQTSDFVLDTVLCNHSKLFTSYTHSQYLNDTVMFSHKTGINEIGSFVLISNEDNVQNQKRILLPGYSSFDNITLQDSTLFWTETRYHNRWEHLKYSVLMKYNFRNNKREQLSRNTRLYSPTYNSKSKTVACLQQSVSGDYSLVLLSSESGELIKEISMPSFIKNIYIDDNGENIYYYILRDKGFELIEYNVASEKQNEILPPSLNNRNKILKFDNCIYFTDDINGVSNIYKKSLASNQISRITDVVFGVGNINKWKNKLVFDNYTSSGWQATTINMDNIQLFDNLVFEHKLYESYIIDSNTNIQKNKPADSLFTSNKYSKIGHLFKLHSWGPIAVNIDNTKVNPGLSFISQNLLSTLELNMGYEYKLDELTNKIYANVDYKAWPVVVSLRTSYQGRREYVPLEDQHYYGYESYTWNETSLGIFLYRGFRFNKNAYNYYVQPSIGISYLDQNSNSHTPDIIKDDLNEILSMSYSIYTSAMRRTAIRDLQPRIGQSLKATYAHTPIIGADLGDILAMESTTYLPFITRHSGMKTYIGLQYKNKEQFSYSNIIEMPRGLVGVISNNSESFIIKQTFAIPLLYPDISISSLAYIKRVKTYLFADYLFGDDLYSSIGADIRFDVHFLRTIAPVDIGLRTSFVTDYSNNEQQVVYQFLLSISI
ncbi:MAG: hypothetical protein DRI86_01720 [Bacteroidetes bacterium]|nr:MAG: hypothetical protein DRI86_01720 [Bacteroidota bacterium]